MINIIKRFIHNTYMAYIKYKREREAIAHRSLKARMKKSEKNFLPFTSQNVYKNSKILRKKEMFLNECQSFTSLNLFQKAKAHLNEKRDNLKTIKEKINENKREWFLENKPIYSISYLNRR